MDLSTRTRSFKMPPLEGSQNVRRARRLEEQKRVSLKTFGFAYSRLTVSKRNKTQGAFIF